MSYYVRKAMDMYLSGQVYGSIQWGAIAGLFDYDELTTADIDYIMEKVNSCDRGPRQLGNYEPISIKVIEHPLVTFEMIKKYFDLYVAPMNNWDIFRNPNITTAIVEKHLDSYLWVWDESYMLQDISMEFVTRHLDKILLDLNYYFSNLASQGNITIEDILGTPDLPWDLSQFTENKNATLEVIARHPEFPWSSDLILNNPNITLDSLVECRFLDSIELDFSKLFNSLEANDENAQKVLKLPTRYHTGDSYIHYYMRKNLYTIEYLNPDDITVEMFTNVSVTRINQKVAKFIEETRVATEDVVEKNIGLDEFTNHGLAQKIAEYVA